DRLHLLRLPELRLENRARLLCPLALEELLGQVLVRPRKLGRPPGDSFLEALAGTLELLEQQHRPERAADLLLQGLVDPADPRADLENGEPELLVAEVERHRDEAVRLRSLELARDELRRRKALLVRVGRYALPLVDCEERARCLPVGAGNVGGEVA